MIKAPTPKMLEILMECHERELQKQEPFGGVKITQNTKGLVERGFIRPAIHTHKATGKVYMAFFITHEGKRYLNNLK